MSWNRPNTYLFNNISKFFIAFQNEQISWNGHKWRKIFNAFKLYFTPVQQTLALFFPKTYFHSGLFRKLCIKLWQERHDCSPWPVARHEDDLSSSIVPILTSQNLRPGAAGVEPAEGIRAIYHWVSLREAFPPLPASRKDRLWAGLLHSQGLERYSIS